MPAYKGTNIAATTAAVTNRFVASTNMSLTPYTIANASPVWAGGCNVTVTHTTVAGADTLGTLVIVGTDLHGQAVTETLTPSAGTTVTGTKVFRTVTSATSVGWVAVSTADTLVIGCAAGSIVAIGGGALRSVAVNTTAAAAITISDSGGTIATLKSNVVEGVFVYDIPWSGYLKVATTAANDVTIIHTTGVPSVYAMA